MKYNYIPTRMAKIQNAKHFGIWKGQKGVKDGKGVSDIKNVKNAE